MRDAEVVPLGSVTSWLSGGTPDRTNEKYWSGSVPWISASTLKDLEIYDSPQRVTPAAVRAGSKMAPIGATLILVRGMALHRELRAGIVTRKVCFNQDVKALIPTPGLLPRFLVYSIYAQRKQILDLVSSAGSGTGVLDTALLKRIQIWLPNQCQQAEAVAILDDVELHLAALERLIAKKQAIKEGLMQQLLTGRKRLLGFAEAWHEVGLGDHATMGSGGTPPSGVPMYYGGGIPWVSISDMTRAGRFVSSTEKTLSSAGLKHSAARLYNDGVVLYAMYASLGECAIAVGRMSSSQAILGIAPNADLDRDFLYYRLSAMKDQVREMGQQGTQSNLNAGMVRDFRLSLPEVDEQRAIAGVLCDVDAEIDILRERLQKADAVKIGMMQLLLTGRARLLAEAAT